MGINPNLVSYGLGLQWPPHVHLTMRHVGSFSNLPTPLPLILTHMPPLPHPHLAPHCLKHYHTNEIEYKHKNMLLEWISSFGAVLSMAWHLVPLPSYKKEILKKFICVWYSSAKIESCCAWRFDHWNVILTHNHTFSWQSSLSIFFLFFVFYNFLKILLSFTLFIHLFWKGVLVAHHAMLKK